MPATFSIASGTLSAYSGNPPGVATPAASPAQGIGDRPTMAGSESYLRAMDQSDPDAIANLTGAVTGRGLYQDITAFIGLLSATYNPSPGTLAVNGVTTQTNPALLGVLSPPALLRAVRDAINFMLTNNPAP